MGRNKAFIIWMCKSRTTKGLSILFGAALFFVAQLGGCKDFGAQQRNFQVCVTGEADRGQCKRLLDITLKQKAWEFSNTPAQDRYYRYGIDEFLRVFVPGDERMRTDGWGSYKVVVEIRPESLEHSFAKWLSITVSNKDRCIANRAVGTVWTIAQLCKIDGKHLESPSSTLYVPVQANAEQLQTCIKTFSQESMRSPLSEALVENGACGSPQAWFSCAEPRGGITKHPESKYGCQVEAVLIPGVHIKYPIYYRYLQDWQSIHASLLHQLNAVMVIKESGGQHVQH